MEEKPNYYAIIPANVRYDTGLKDKAKLLYGEITALSNQYGYCYASNRYFADLYGVSVRTITDLIKDLVDNNYIKSEIVYKDDTKEVSQRRLYLVKNNSIPIEENFYTPIEENFQYNNINNNNTSNNNIFKKPTIEQVEEYCKERNNGINAQKFVDFYESKGWMVGKNKMKDWKACVRTWEKQNKKCVIQEKELPNWFDKEQDIHIITKQEEEEMKSILAELQ